jgi:hypothetical protein
VQPAPRAGDSVTHAGGTVMTFAAVTLLGLTVGQPLGADYVPMNSRSISIPVEYKKDRKQIRQVLLYVARNGENTWYQEAAVTPDKDAFAYFAKDDGIYWFKMVIEDLKGNRDPADLTRDPPDLKMVFDTSAPQVRFTGARRTGEEVVVEWQAEDKFPNDAETKVHFRHTDGPKSQWQEVTLPPNSRSGVKFACGTAEAVTVRVTAVDVAGNRTEATKDFPAAGGAAPPATRAAYSPPTPPAPTSPPAPVTPVGGTGVGGAPAVVPPPTSLDPASPAAPGPAAPTGPAPVVPPAPPFVTPAPPAPPAPAAPAPTVPFTPSPAVPVNTSVNAPAAQPLATVDPKAPPSGAVLPTQGGAVPAAGAGQPTVEVTRAQVINYPRFDLGFDLEQRGPSGISRVDVWVTRDEGRTWNKWSQHDGKGGVVRVVLDVRENTQLEGSYGFRLVPVSGAGLSEREPAPGDVPEMRVVLDLTAPQIDLYPPVPDPNAPDTLVLQWKATDRNFGEEPIALEWGATPTGPWKPVALTGSEPVVQATAIAAPTARRLANTGQYSWRVPAGVPAHVYLKATARDAAGNVKEVVTVKPIPVDLTKPRAKINGIVPATPGKH